MVGGIRLKTRIEAKNDPREDLSTKLLMLIDEKAELQHGRQ